MACQQKTTEALACVAAEDPVAFDYPLLNAEVGISGATISEVAAVVTSAFQQWQIIGTAIEAVRLGTRAAIGAAETAEDAHGAFATMEWPSI